MTLHSIHRCSQKEHRHDVLVGSSDHYSMALQNQRAIAGGDYSPCRLTWGCDGVACSRCTLAPASATVPGWGTAALCGWLVQVPGCYGRIRHRCLDSVSCGDSRLYHIYQRPVDQINGNTPCSQGVFVEADSDVLVMLFIIPVLV